MRKVTASKARRKKAKRKELSRCHQCVRNTKCMDAYSAPTFEGKCLPSGS